MTATITELGMSEDWFWNTEPRVVVNMLNEKQELDRYKIKALATYIACYVWGNDPDENTKKEVAGINKPVTEDILSKMGL